MNEIVPGEDVAADRVDMRQWVSEAQEINKMAHSLVQTSFVPTSMKNKPHEATAAILTGLEIGLRPMSALRSIDVIHGTPALRAVALRGLVQSAGHHIWVEESSKTRVVVRGRRKGEEEVQESVWTTDRAKDLGLTGKENWKKQPTAMLVARATSEMCRLIAADVIMGMPYSTEEIEDSPGSEASRSKRAPGRTAKREPIPEANAEESATGSAGLDAAETPQQAELSGNDPW